MAIYYDDPERRRRYDEEEGRYRREYGTYRRYEDDRVGYGSRGYARDYGYRSEGRWVEGPQTGRGPRGYQRSDERIHEEVCERLTQHGQIDASDIEIEVQQGEVTLTGTVTDRRAKRLAEDVAESVMGVKDVHNRLRLGSIGWAEGIAGRRETDSEGWVEGMGRQPHDSEGWVEGVGHKDRTPSEGWAEGMTKK